MASLSKMQRVERAKLNIINGSVDSFLAKLELSFIDLNSRISSLTATLDTKAGAIISNRVNLQRSLEMRGQIANLLGDTGFNKAVGNLSLAYDKITARTAEGLRAAGIDPKFTVTDVQSLTAIKAMDFRRWEAFSNDLVNTVQSGILDSVVAGEPISILSGKIGDTLLGIGESPSLFRSRAQTLANTYIQGFDRTVTARKAQQAGIETFVYLGPKDDLTREFCSDVLAGIGNKVFNIPSKPGKVIYTLSEIEAMNNGTPLNPLQFGGGFNCRHKFRPISKELAKELK